MTIQDGWQRDGFTGATLRRDYESVATVYRSGKGYVATVDGIPEAPTFPTMTGAMVWAEAAADRAADMGSDASPLPPV